MKRVMLLGAVLAVTMFVAPQASALTEIDHFEEGFFQIQADSGATTAVDDQTGLTTVAGGRRRAELTWNSGTGAGLEVSTNVLDQTPPASNHWLDFFADTDQTGTLVLKYGLIASNPLGSDVALGDLTLAGANSGLLIDFIKADFSAITSITLVDSSANSAMVNKLAPGDDSILYYDFTEFVGVDAANIDSMIVQINGVDDGDYRIDAIEATTIPEPLTLIGMTLGIGGLARYTRKRRRA